MSRRLDAVWYEECADACRGWRRTYWRLRAALARVMVALEGAPDRTLALDAPALHWPELGTTDAPALLPASALPSSSSPDSLRHASASENTRGARRDARAMLRS